MTDGQINAQIWRLGRHCIECPACDGDFLCEEAHELLWPLPPMTRKALRQIRGAVAAVPGPALHFGVAWSVGALGALTYHAGRCDRCCPLPGGRWHLCAEATWLDDRTQRPRDCRGRAGELLEAVSARAWGRRLPSVWYVFALEGWISVPLSNLPRDRRDWTEHTSAISGEDAVLGELRDRPRVPHRGAAVGYFMDQDRHVFEHEIEVWREEGQTATVTRSVRYLGILPEARPVEAYLAHVAHCESCTGSARGQGARRCADGLALSRRIPIDVYADLIGASVVVP